MPTSSDRWKQLEALFYKCLTLEPEARSSFLNDSCAGDTELKKEVAALLEEAVRPMDLLEQPIFEAAHVMVAESTPAILNRGTRIGHYEIILLLARGGMGQVYLAEDTTLERKVALKVLAPAFIHDDRRLSRFEREARAASSLNHPNIVTIYEFGEFDGLHFIASEFVDGLTLRQKLSSGRLDVNTMLDIAIQISAALTAAHSAGIVHRDIKPENVMIRSDGLVKVLDFGIAKLSGGPSVSQTIDTRASLTQQGMLIGTVAYMSPEQAAGKELDVRSDLFSFGAVLYEMATGATPFPGDSAREIIESILSRPPMPLLQLNPELPKRLEGIISRALEKDKIARYQESSALRSDLEWLQTDLYLHKTIVMGRPAASKGKKKRTWIIIGVLVLTMVLLAGYFVSRRAAKLTDKDTVVLADFSNTTNDPVFDGTLREGLSAQLEQSPFLNLLSDRRVAQTLSSMAQPKDTRLTGELAREVCQRTASAATIEGSIASLGSQYVLGLKAVNCSNGDLLAEEQITADSKEHVLKVLGEAATKLRARLGESLASVQRYDALNEPVTTASIEALRAYSLGYQEMIVRNNYAAAISLFRRAISLDPNFALAYARLANAYFYLGETERGAESLRKAYELRDAVNERERFYIESHYQQFVTGDLEAARKTLELWSEIYPRDGAPPNNLGVVYASLGDHDKCLAAVQDALRLNPSGISYAGLVTSYLNLDRLQEAKATAQQAQARHLDTPFLRQSLYLVDFLRRDAAGMQREVDSQMGKPGSEDTLLYFESDSAAYAGHFAKAGELTRRAIDSAMRADEKETAAGYEAESAVREALAGNMGIAKQQARAALRMSRGKDVQAISAIALALAGDLAQATPLARDLAERFPEDTIVQFNYLPTIRAATALKSGGAAKAIEALAPAAPFDLGGPVNQSPNFSLYPVYLRGLAFVAVRQGPAAASEFQKILNHSGLVVNEPIGALAHLGVGRAYVLSGETEKARHAYQDFLTLWKDADPDILVLQQARAEYAKLH